MPAPKPDLVDDVLRQSLRVEAGHVAERLLGPRNRGLSSPDEWRWGTKGSISVTLRGPKAGSWYDFESGTGGDMLALVQRENGGDFARAAEWARSFTGVAPERHTPVPSRPAREPFPPDAADEARRMTRMEYARRLADESVPVDGTPADHYLRQVRGIPRPEGGWPDAVRWHPDRRALLVVATDAAGDIRSVQRVHLTPDGTKIDSAERAERGLRAVKITNGLGDAAVRLPATPGRGGPLLLAEGPETGLAVWASTGHETWIALGSVAKLDPPTDRRVVLVADDNPRVTEPRIGAAERGVEKTLAEWQARGVDVVRALPWPERRHDRTDFADLVLQQGPDAVRERLAPAVLAPTITRGSAAAHDFPLKEVAMSEAPAPIPVPLAFESNPPSVGPVSIQAGQAPRPPRLSPDARIVQEALDTIVTARHPQHADELKAHVAQALQNREMVLGVLDLPAETRVLAGKTPVHTLDEMREVAGLVRARTATPEDRAVPSPALAELRQSLEEQVQGKATFRDLTRLYGEADIGRSIAAVSAHPVEGPKLKAALDATERRLLDEERVRQGIGRGDAVSFTRPATEPEPAPSRSHLAARGMDEHILASGIPTGMPYVSGFAFTAAGPRRDRGDDDDGARIPRMPPAIQGYTVREREGAREYVQASTGRVAFRASAERIEGVLRDRATVGDMLDLARGQGWTTVRVEGDREVARLAWIEAAARGIAVEGYRPTLDDRHALDQRKLERRDQGHEAFETAPRRGVAPDVAERPERAPTAREGRLARDAWATATGGYDALKPQQQEHAKRAYDTWAAAQPDKGEGFNLHRYVAHVQDKQAERRADRERRHTPPHEQAQVHETELPSRYAL